MLVDLPDVAAVERFAALLAVELAAGDIVLVDGPLGAGKTTLARALVAALGGDPATVASPTFTLLNSYAARLPVWHVDAYRLDGAGALAALGFFELVEDGVAIVEWAERVAAAFDRAACWSLRLAHAAPGRRLVVEPPAGKALRDGSVR